jgi:hypothetical protein
MGDTYELWPRSERRPSARDEALEARGIRIPRRSGAPRPMIEASARPRWLVFLMRVFAR